MVSTMRPGRGDITITRSDRKTGLADRMGDQQDSLARCTPDIEQVQVHLLARHGVQGAKRLIHQQESRIVQQAARDGRTLLHAAGEFVRVALAEPLQLHELQQ